MATQSTKNLPRFDKPLDFHEAFVRTMTEFRITNEDLAQKTGIASTKISNYRTGRSGWSGINLERILRALSDEQRDFFLSLAFTQGHHNESA